MLPVHDDEAGMDRIDQGGEEAEGLDILRAFASGFSQENVVRTFW